MRRQAGVLTQQRARPGPSLGGVARVGTSCRWWDAASVPEPEHPSPRPRVCFCRCLHISCRNQLHLGGGAVPTVSPVPRARRGGTGGPRLEFSKNEPPAGDRR